MYWFLVVPIMVLFPEIASQDEFLAVSSQCFLVVFIHLFLLLFRHFFVIGPACFKQLGSNLRMNLFFVQLKRAFPPFACPRLPQTRACLRYCPIVYFKSKNDKKRGQAEAQGACRSGKIAEKGQGRKRSLIGHSPKKRKFCFFLALLPKKNKKQDDSV